MEISLEEADEILLNKRRHESCICLATMLEAESGHKISSQKRS